MTAAPLVSIVIPTFNRANMIGSAVRSCLEQTHPNCEIIVVDDGSTDNTTSVIASIARNADGKLRVLKQHNAGASAARNTGLAAARGTYVQFLDSDDVLHPAKIEHHLEAILRVPNCDAALCFGRLEHANGSERIGMDLGNDPMATVEELCSKTVHVVQTSSPLWRRNFLTGERIWNPGISLGDDLEFHIRCLADARAIAFVPAELFVVKYHCGDRLSDFSIDDQRLRSLLTTREAIFRALSAKNRWTTRCADNFMAVMGSLYINFLRRLPDPDVRRLEGLIREIGSSSASSAQLHVLVLVRRLLGRKAALAFADGALVNRGATARGYARAVRRLAGGLKRRLMRIGRMRPADAAKGIRSLSHARFSSPEPRTVLLVEPNEFHSETLPGYITLLKAAGYSCWLLDRPRADVAGALSRLSPQDQPKRLTMSLWAMAHYLRSPMATRFDLVFFNSGTIAEQYGFFGGVLEYVCRFPATRLGYLIVEHSDATLAARRDLARLDVDRLFALTPVNRPDLKLKMLAPVDFGNVRQTALSEPVVFVTVGRISPAHRNFAALVDAIKSLKGERLRPFKVIAIGSRLPDSGLLPSVDGQIEFVGFLPFAEMYNVLERAHFVLPLLNSRIESHRQYLAGNTSGSRQLVLGFEKVGIWERAFAEAYCFTNENAVIYEAGGLRDGMRTALAMQPAHYVGMVAATRKLKQEVFQASLANLEAFLRAQGDHRPGRTR